MKFSKMLLVEKLRLAHVTEPQKTLLLEGVVDATGAITEKGTVILLDMLVQERAADIVANIKAVRKAELEDETEVA